MDRTDLRLCRSLLFLPASNPRAIEKARTLAADMVILDLEDAVKEEDKAAAREAAVAATRGGLRRAARRRSGSIRRQRGISARTSSRSATARPTSIVLAKAESAKQVHDAGWLMGKPVLAMIETPRRAWPTPPRSPPSQRRLIAGTNDLAADSAACRRGRGGRASSTRCSGSCSPRAPAGSPRSTASTTARSRRGPGRRVRGGARLRLRRQVGDPSEPDRHGQPRLLAERGRDRGGASG